MKAREIPLAALRVAKGIGCPDTPASVVVQELATPAIEA
jgi:hypothetical protein